MSGLNATDKRPRYEVPLIYVFGVLGLGRAFCVLGYWAMAFCQGDPFYVDCTQQRQIIGIYSYEHVDHEPTNQYDILTLRCLSDLQKVLILAAYGSFGKSRLIFESSLFFDIVDSASSNSGLLAASVVVSA